MSGGENEEEGKEKGVASSHTPAQSATPPPEQTATPVMEQAPIELSAQSTRGDERMEFDPVTETKKGAVFSPTDDTDSEKDSQRESSKKPLRKLRKKTKSNVDSRDIQEGMAIAVAKAAAAKKEGTDQ